MAVSSVVDAVVAKLRSALTGGRWNSGQMLPGQRELAEELGISRPSLREAIMVLETQGWLQSLPGKGVKVLEQQAAAPSAAASLADLLQVRYTLEPFIAGLVAQSAGSDELVPLRLAVQGLREAQEDQDQLAGRVAYREFHETLLALNRNPIFAQVVQQTAQALREGQAQAGGLPELGARLEECSAVLKAIRAADSEAASQRMRAHVLAEASRLGVSLARP